MSPITPPGLINALWNDLLNSALSGVYQRSRGGGNIHFEYIHTSCDEFQRIYSKHVKIYKNLMFETYRYVSAGGRSPYLKGKDILTTGGGPLSENSCKRTF